MKKVIIFIIFLNINWIGLSQPCLPDGITLYNQSDIDNFQTNNPNCTEIEGFLIIGTIGGSDITNLNGLSVLNSIGEELVIWDNTNLPNLIGLDNLTSIGGHLIISNNSGLTTLSGLNSLISIGENLQVNDNYDLTSLTGLENLTSIAISCEISFNPVLINLTGLENLTTVGAQLIILYNLTLTSLSGLENLNSVEWELAIGGNDALTNLTALNNLTTIGENLYITNNAMLPSLSGLENISAASITTLSIHNNDLLATCDVNSICDYLSNPNGTIEIYENDSGCNDQTEVIEACEAQTVLENNIKSGFSIQPQPATNKIFISSKDELEIESINIYNQLGQIVILVNKSSNILDVSNLKKGIYIIEIESKGLIFKQKLIKE